MKYEAQIIIGVGPILPNGSMHCALQNGVNAVATKEMISRFIPQEGDYWVVQPDGYAYVNPKDVFERKYWTSQVPGDSIEQVLQDYMRMRTSLDHRMEGIERKATI